MIEKLFNLRNKHILITGSTSGIGYALAKGFKEAGCTVWLHGKTEEQCKKAAEELNTYWVSGDLENAEDILKISDTIKKTQRLDILINNAGVELHNDFESLDMEVYEKTLSVNLKSVISLTHKLLPLLKASGKGNILNITSIHQDIPYKYNAPYCISKAALSMFTKCIALELGPYNIRVNNLAPGAVRTEINKEILNSMIADFERWIPLGHVANVEEMVGAALYLCSDASTYTTGTTLYVDGGYKEHLVRYSHNQ